MALQTSGAISLNEIHVEAGGTSGTLCTINDSDIRALISASSEAQMSFDDWYGASSSLDTQTVTSQISGTYGSSQYFQGYRSGVHGSISDGTCNFKSGATIINLYSSHFYSTDRVFFELTGNHANSGFTTMSFNGNNYARTAATYSYQSASNKTQWYWTDPTGGNPFGHTSGSLDVTVTWT
jgi:hypothetical protein